MAAPTLDKADPRPPRQRTGKVRLRSWYDKTGFWLLLLLPVRSGRVDARSRESLEEAAPSGR